MEQVPIGGLIIKSQLTAPALPLRRDRGLAITFGKIKATSAICLMIFVAYAGLRISNLTALTEVRQFPDTQAYREKANWPLWSWGGRAGPLQGTLAWWLRGRSPTVPLFFKMAANRLRAIAFLQLGLSVLSWALLALFVARAIEFNWLKPVAFLIVLLFSLSDYIIMWDTITLSDSISVSLMVLLVASWFWLLENWRWQKAALMLMIASLWVFSRDSNAWVVLMMGMLLLALGSFWRSPRYLCVAAMFAMLFIANEVSQNYSRRWVMPFFNVIGLRVLPNTESTAYFAQLGMPVTPALMARSGKYASDDDWAFYGDPALRGFQAWTYARGKLSYTRFLLAHPIATLKEPLANVERLLDPDVSDYVSSSFSPILSGVFAKLIYFQKSALRWVSASALLSAAVLTAALRTRQPRWLVTSALLMLTYPHAVLVWHGDSMEVERHALQAAVQFRLGLWMAIFCGCDAILVYAARLGIRSREASGGAAYENRSLSPTLGDQF